MECKYCGFPMAEGTNMCPKCGKENTASVRDDIDFIELPDEEPEITATMAPPTLNVGEENLKEGIGDLGSSEEVSSYATEEDPVKIEEDMKPKEAGIDIAIPSVTKAIDVTMPVDGTAPEMIQDNDTIGENTHKGMNKPTKKNKFKIAVPKINKNFLIVVAVVFLIVGVLIGKTFFAKNYCVSTQPTKNNLTNTKVKFVSDGKNNKTNINNYTYKIPEQYKYDKNLAGVVIYNAEDTFRIFIRTLSAKYSELSGAKRSIRETLKNNDFVVNNYKEIKISDVELLVFETTTKTTNRMLAFAASGEDRVFYMEIVTLNNNFDYKVLEVATDIIKNAQYEPATTNMESIDFKNISDVLVTSALEYKNLVNQ